MDHIKNKEMIKNCLEKDENRNKTIKKQKKQKKKKKSERQEIAQIKLVMKAENLQLVLQ